MAEINKHRLNTCKIFSFKVKIPPFYVVPDEKLFYYANIVLIPNLHQV